MPSIPTLSDKHMAHTAVIAIGSIAVAVALVKTTLALVKSKDCGYALPMVPYTFPFIGSTFEYAVNPLQFAKNNTEKFGSVFRMHFHGAITTVVGATDAPEVFQHPHLSFRASKSRFFGSALFERSDGYTLPNNSLPNAIKKYLTPNLNEFSPRAFEQFLKEIDGRALDKQFTVPNLLPFFRRFVSKYSATVFVGTRMSLDEGLISAFEHAVADIGTEFKPGPLQLIFPWYNSLYINYLFPKSDAIKKYRALIKSSLSKEITKRTIEQAQDDYVEDNKIKDVLDYLLKEHPHAVDDNHLESLTTIIMLLIFVGVHTTSDTLTNVMYCLALHPEYIQELRQEQAQVILAEQGHEEHVIYTPAMYRRMVKLDSFIRESMRTRFAGIGQAHTNISHQDIVLKSGAIVEPGHEVFVNQYQMHHDKTNQGGFDNLETFDGFRFVGSSDKLAVQSGQDNVSFGMGKHACPGRWFAIHQIKGIASYFIRNYDISAKSEIRIMNTTTLNHVGRSTGIVQFTKIIQ